MLHCIEQNASSGVNHFADGFNVAKQLKKINSQAFEILCHCDVPWIAKGTDFFGDFVTGHFHRTVM